MDMDMAEVFDFRFPSQCSTPCLWWFAFVVFSFCCQSQLSCLLACALFMEVMRLLFYLSPFFTSLTNTSLSAGTEPRHPVFLFLFGGKTLYEFEFCPASKGTISRSFLTFV